MVLPGLLPLVRVVVGHVYAREIGAVVEVEGINSSPGDKGGVVTLVHSSLGLPLGPLAGMEVLKVLSEDNGIRLHVKIAVLATVAGYNTVVPLNPECSEVILMRANGSGYGR